MRHITYRFRAAISAGHAEGSRGDGQPRLYLNREIRKRETRQLKSLRASIRHALLDAALIAAVMVISASAETRPRYGGTMRVMMQSAPDALVVPANATPAEYWDAAHTLSLIGDTLVALDAEGRAQPALAVAWQSDPGGRRWQFTLRRGVKFHDGSVASPAAIAQILGALHSNWIVRASPDSVSVSVENEAAIPSMLAELALPRNLLLKRNGSGDPIGTGPFLVTEWQPGKLLKLAAYEESWAGRPFVDAIDVEFGKSLRDQAIALELDKADLIEAPPQASAGSQQHTASLSLPVELLVLVFSANSKARAAAEDLRLREALALAIDRKPIQSVLLKGAGEPAASLLPNWMTGYSAVFSAQANLQRARTLLAGSRQPALHLSYDPRDPQAQLIAERIALNAHEVGIAVQVSLSGGEDVRLMRIALPSPDPGTSLAEAARQLAVPQPAFTAASRVESADGHSPNDPSVDNLYQAERNLLTGYAVIPLFHLPLAAAASTRVQGWKPSPLGEWNRPGQSLADVWLADSRPQASTR
jgi:peptide/nickel transport system substrate-binding protein